MGRGVETIGENVLYFDTENFTDNFEWCDLIDNLRHGLTAAFSSLEFTDQWASYPYRENRGILENSHIIIYVSEYGGCGAVSVVISEDEHPDLADYWLSQVWKRFTKIVGENVDLLNRIGTMSNGVSVYEKEN